jgi:hypothetical protein
MIKKQPRWKPALYTNLLFIFLIAVSGYTTFYSFKAIIQKSTSIWEAIGYSIVFLWTLSFFACFSIGMFLSNSE